MSNDRTQLLNPALTVAAATAGAQFVNASAEKIHKDRTEGPLTYRAMAFMGGLAMIPSNIINVPSRFFSFHFSGALIALYGTIFGIIITMLEGPGPCGKCTGRGVRYYAKFLEYTWGRGLLYFFVGSLQVSNVNILDWVVGGWMVFTGVVAIGVSFAANRQMSLLKFSIKSEEDLRARWIAHDSNGDGTFDIKDLTRFIQSSGLRMTRNEIAAAFLALDRNFDEHVSYEEFYAWWSSDGRYGHQRGLAV
mmetsp:Transcript_3238/g.5478  ORF Transcript_3238/g.5478 Transcript_3238/m.5478 type:complete len:249 (+) Transcript_3238:22-768(+)